MEKRLVLAIALSMLVLLTWSILVPKPQLIVNKEVTNNKVELLPGAAPVPATTNQVLGKAAIETVIFKHEKQDIVFIPSLAAVQEITFQNNLPHRFPLKIGFLSNPGLLFKQQSITGDSITFVHEDKDIRIVKRFSFGKLSNIMDLDISIQNISSAPLTVNPQLILGSIDISHRNPQARFHDVTVSTSEKTSHFSAAKNINSQGVKFIGFRDQYFCAIIQPNSKSANTYIKKINNDESEIGILESQVVINPGSQIGHSYRIYLGPQDLKILGNVNPDWTTIVHFGTFDFIAQLLLQLLNFFYGLVHNWGWAIIILSIAIYLLLFPLSVKQMRSMKEMQALQPKIEALRVQYKDNPQKLNKEVMELYREHKVNPLSGCLPLLLQMPIFFALYQALIRSVALRGARFWWIKDLSSPDQLFVFKNSIPFFGNQFNLLPILMAAGMFIQQKISMGKVSGEAAQQQKIMSIVMPIMFGVIFYQMPAGLVLYWFINSLFMLVYQFKINKQK